MNKKIKVIDLINIIAKNQDIPQRIRVDKDIYNWDIEEFYKREDGKDLFVLADFYNTIGFLELEVEILEDNTEEIEGFKGETFEQLGYEVGKLSISIIKGLEKAIKESREE